MNGELFAVSWKPNGGMSKRIWAVYPSLGDAARVAHGYASSNGGGTWMVYSTREVSTGQSVRSVLDQVLLQGLA